MADTVPMSEIDDAFYGSYKDPKSGTLDPRLADPKTGKRRPLTTDAADAEFRREWTKIKKHLEEVKKCAAKGGGGKVGAKAACPPAAKKPDDPPYEPGKWNDKGAVQNSTNCYAYAMNSRTGHPADDKPQPGDKSSTNGPGSTNTCPDVTSRVLADGAPAKKGDPASIESAPQCPYQKQHHLPPPDKKGYYLVALVVTSIKSTAFDPVTKTYNISDYHWYRQDDSGNWSGKPGHDEASDKDASGKTITNPETCDHDSKSLDKKTGVTVRINYDIFCGYFYVQKGGAQVGS
jgi:hypothetical protein